MAHGNVFTCLRKYKEEESEQLEPGVGKKR
jgi:hypothetical protein